MCILPSLLSGMHQRSTPHFRRARTYHARISENHKSQTSPFPHDFRTAPSRINAVEDDGAFLGRFGNKAAEFSNDEDFKEFGNIVSIRGVNC